MTDLTEAEDGAQPHPDDAEFRAMAQILMAIDMVHAHDARMRVLRYVLDRLDIDATDLT
jgi:hypothetical protein